VEEEEDDNEAAEAEAEAGLDLDDDPRGVRLLAAPPAVKTVIFLRTVSAVEDDDMVNIVSKSQSSSWRTCCREGCN
jgi:hypothetical protein